MNVQSCCVHIVATRNARFNALASAFDSSILAAVLTRALEIKMNEKDAEIFLCESDSDLQPWDKFGARKLPLAQLYDDARIWVYGDFLMTSPDRPVDWPI